MGGLNGQPLAQYEGLFYIILYLSQTSLVETDLFKGIIWPCFVVS